MSRLVNSWTFTPRIACLVSGHEGLIKSLELPDPDDRHVLAAAVYSRAQVIVTRNLKDFPQEQLGPYDVVVQHPDGFICDLMDLSAFKVVAAAQEHRTSLSKPSKTVEQDLDTLERQELTRTAAALRPFRRLL